jgi:hypothetical protein
VLDVGVVPPIFFRLADIQIGDGQNLPDRKRISFKVPGLVGIQDDKIIPTEIPQPVFSRKLNRETLH